VPRHAASTCSSSTASTAHGVPRYRRDIVNGAGSDAEPRLGPDGTTLYFSSERRSSSPADADADWNNGKYKLRVVDLRPWLGH
jgi:hypothetical protein